MANILLITDYYPPRKSIATNRMKSFEKYLSHLGHKMFVITLGDKDSCIVDGTTTVYYCQDNDAIKKLDTSIKESALKHYFKCAWNIFCNNIHLYSASWVKSIISVAEMVIQNNNIDVMITSYPSIGTIVAGEKIKGKYPNIKWIMDMRDAVWTPGNSEFVRNKMVGITKKSMAVCDAVTSVSDPQLQQYKKYNTRIIDFAVIKNGYDFEVPKINSTIHDSFKIVYTGNFYGARSPQNFLIAFERFVINNNVNDAHFEIIGNGSVVHFNNNLQEYVIEKPRLEYGELVNYCADCADLLLVVIPKSQEQGVYTGKLFDYIGIGKPIIGLVPKDDVAAELITQAGNGYIAENENVEEIEAAIFKAYTDWKNNTVPKIDKSVQVSCHRRVQVAKLDELIQRLC